MPTLLGLTTYVVVGGVEPVRPFEEQWLAGRAGARILLQPPDGEGLPDQGLVPTREWFTGAVLDENHAYLRVFVHANTGVKPFFPPVGQERDPDEGSDVFMHDLVGWGFAFDFDGDAPIVGKWALD